LLYALVLLGAPLVWTSGLGLSLLSQMGIAIIICLSFNILFGQGGMLSFGHAVYSGLGAYVAMHGLNAVSRGQMDLPVSLIPLVGGLGGLAFAALLGYPTTRRAGTTFAMITLGVGELVGALALMLPEFFGGEAGVSGNRVVGEPVWGISYGPHQQLAYLIAVYCLVCTALMYAFSRTPLGRLLNAVRDNPQRVAFIGYNPNHVRYLAFMVAGFFAGVGGGLMALNFEIVTADVLSATRSGSVLLFVFLGGAGFFVGPIIGAVLMVLATVLLSEWTKAWLLYLGVAFVWMVIASPGGLASLVVASVGAVRQGSWRRWLWPGLVCTLCAAMGLAGWAALIEMTYHRQLQLAIDPLLPFMGLSLDTAAAPDFVLAGALALVGTVLAIWRWKATVRGRVPSGAGGEPGA
jgi:branched-chain amino acid transport system permease protein